MKQWNSWDRDRVKVALVEWAHDVSTCGWEGFPNPLMLVRELQLGASSRGAVSLHETRSRRPPEPRIAALRPQTRDVTLWLERVSRLDRNYYRALLHYAVTGNIVKAADDMKTSRSTFDRLFEGGMGAILVFANATARQAARSAAENDCK